MIKLWKLCLWAWICPSMLLAQSVHTNFLPELSGFRKVYEDHSEDELSIPLPGNRRREIVGDKTFIQYEYNMEAESNPGNRFVFSTYETEMEEMELNKIYLEESRRVYSIKRNDEMLIVIVETYQNAAVYSVTILRPKTKSPSERMYEQLEREGHLALYINFGTGTSELDAEAEVIIDQIAELMEANPDLHIRIDGHTDNVGDDAANKKLSYERAKTVMRQIIRKGISPSRLSAKGWGEEKPIASNDTEKGRRKNRRVELVKK